MDNDLRQEGTIAARVSHQHADWATNKTNYRFDPQERGRLHRFRGSACLGKPRFSSHRPCGAASVGKGEALLAGTRRALN